MFSILAGLLYLSAIVLPVWLLYRFGPRLWIWHVLALALALVIGLLPGTALLQSVAGTFVYGFVFFVLSVWAIGGLYMMVHRWFAHKPHAHRATAH
jgi:hypothetical protein